MCVTEVSSQFNAHTLSDDNVLHCSKVEALLNSVFQGTQQTANMENDRIIGSPRQAVSARKSGIKCDS